MCTTGCRQCTVQNGCRTGLRQSRCMCTTGCFQDAVRNGGHTGLRHILCTSGRSPGQFFGLDFLDPDPARLPDSWTQVPGTNLPAPCLEEKIPWSNRTPLERYPALIFPGIEHAFHKFSTRQTTKKKEEPETAINCWRSHV